VDKERRITLDNRLLRVLREYSIDDVARATWGALNVSQNVEYKAEDRFFIAMLLIMIAIAIARQRGWHREWG
jgi:hypothetical protein